MVMSLKEDIDESGFYAVSHNKKVDIFKISRFVFDK